MKERFFAVIGHPIGHTMSPFIHARLFELTDKPAKYGVFDIGENELYEKLPELKKLDGFNITIPHKQSIIPFLDKIDEKANCFGSVNTVHTVNGISSGYTTDPDGFLKALKAGGAKLTGRNVIVGAGGVARVMAFEAAMAGGEVTIAVREHGVPKAKQLVQDIREKIKYASINFCLIDELTEKIDLLINATPVGMYPKIDASPINISIIKNCAAVFDAVYNPNDTSLIKLARSNGALTVGGMDMLVWQAVAAHEIWDNVQYDIADIRQLSRDSITEMEKVFGRKL